MIRIYKKGWTKTTPRGGTLTITRIREDKSADLVCSICHSDKELFPEDLNLKVPTELKTKCPCACAKNYRWNEAQRVVHLKRECKKRGYIFKGFKEEFQGNKTYIVLYNPVTDNEWDTCNIANFLNNGRGDPAEAIGKRGDARRIDIKERILKVESILKDENIPQRVKVLTDTSYTSYNKFQWVCKRGHLIKSTFNNFINHGTRCKTCYHLTNSFSGFVTNVYEDKRKDDDYLYILKIESPDETFYKIGRSFNPERRKIDISSDLPKNYKVYLLYLEKHSHEMCVERERRLLKITEDSHYLPKEFFNGYTEARKPFNLEEITNM